MITNTQTNIGNQQQIHLLNRRKFGIAIIFLQILITILYAFFVKVKPHSDPNTNTFYYPMYQDVNVLVLIGFGFLMTYIKKNAWSSLVYTFFINAIIVQLYVLLAGFWQRLFHNAWQQQKIFVEEKTFTLASYASASILVAFGSLLGKVGPFELLIMGLIGIVGYTLNQQLIFNVLKTFDAGGSISVHVFGAYYGLAISFILSRKVKPSCIIQTSYGNIIFALIGTFFFWIYWPSNNAGYAPINPFHRTLIINNTIVGLTGSCLAALAFTSLFRKKFNMQDILNSTIAGGVIIGGPSGVVTNMGVSLAIGLIGGTVSAFGYYKLTQMIQHSFLGIHDTCGANNLHGIPGLLGGIISGIVIASYQTYPGLDEYYKPYLNLQVYGRTYSQQAGIQIASTFVSFGIAIVFGLGAGLVLYSFYNFDCNQFFKDEHYFQLPHEEQHLPGIPLAMSSLAYSQMKNLKFN